MKKSVIAIATLGLLTGCVSMLTHTRFSDSEIIGQAENMAFANTCSEKGLAPGAGVSAYGYAVTQLLSVSVYNKNLYEKTYKDRKSLLARYSPESYSEECKELTSILPMATKNVSDQYIDISRARQAEIAGMSQSTAAFGRSMPSYNQQYNQPSHNQANFSPSANQTNHYLVDFGSGQRLCMSTNSGYVRCQ